MNRDYLVESLNAYWFAPPVALWRAIELRTVSRLHYDTPLLDLGCGDGLIGQLLFGPQNGTGIGLDPWLDQLRQAATLGVYQHVDQGSGLALPYADRRFLTVFSNSVLEHIENVQPVIREIARVLRPEGRFIFTVPSDAFRHLLDGYVQRVAEGDPRGAEAYADTVDECLEHYHYLEPNEWKELLSRGGMRLLRAEYYLPREVEGLWDRMNRRYGIGRGRTAWKTLVSPRLRHLGYQSILRQIVVRHFSERWRPYYRMDVRPGDKGGGLLVVALRKE